MRSTGKYRIRRTDRIPEHASDHTTTVSRTALLDTYYQRLPNCLPDLPHLQIWQKQTNRGSFSPTHARYHGYLPLTFHPVISEREASHDIE